VVLGKVAHSYSYGREVATDAHDLIDSTRNFGIAKGEVNEMENDVGSALICPAVSLLPAWSRRSLVSDY